MNISYNILVYSVWFMSTYFLVFLLLILFLKRKELFKEKAMPKVIPLVSIIVPAYNEEESIAETIDSLKKVNYEKLEIVVVNDGSKDNTSSIVKKAIAKDPRFTFLDNKNNKGKAACLNQGIKVAKGEFIGCMDADSVIEKDILIKTVPYFQDKKMGAVTVSVEAYKPKRFLDKIIDLEFTLGLSLFLKAFSFLNSVFVTPGPFSIYRKKVLLEIKGFDKDNITEDFEIAFKIHRAGHKIGNCMAAKVFTLVPPSFKQLYVQRRRWYTGSVQTIIKHRDMMLKPKYGAFGFWIPFNYSLIFTGLGLFVYAFYLGFSKLLENINSLRYTNFNIWERLMQWSPDILTFARVNMMATTIFVASIILMFAGLKFARKKYSEKKLGMLGYPFIFILYQIFWIGSIFALLKGGKVKWR